jgi:hypothetical protein
VSCFAPSFLLNYSAIPCYIARATDSVVKWTVKNKQNVLESSINALTMMLTAVGRSAAGTAAGHETIRTALSLNCCLRGDESALVARPWNSVTEVTSLPFLNRIGRKDRREQTKRYGTAQERKTGAPHQLKVIREVHKEGFLIYWSFWIIKCTTVMANA